MCVSCFARINLMDIFIQSYDNKLVTASCKEDSCDNKKPLQWLVRAVSCEKYDKKMWFVRNN